MTNITSTNWEIASIFIVEEGRCRIKVRRFIGIILFLFICVGEKANGEIYYVKTDGDDTKNGLTLEEAWQHPSYATNQLKAGDTLYLVSGTWNDEHIVLANSGTQESPITLAGYEGIAILDGVDKKGIGIRAVAKSYFTISGVHIRNYYEGISLEDTMTGVTLKDFIIEGTQRTGLIFKGAGESIASDINISDFTIYETGWDGYPAISHGYGWNSHDIEIYNFEIRDTYGEGINWRFSKRVHIYDGKIYNTASDAIHLQLCIDDSVVERMWIKDTGWHGIAIHDHTVGDYPCYNNIIRNCYVGYALHNDIDLHSGAFNTIVENCTLDGTPATGQGIYFHNLGSGLIVRNNVIYNTGDGIDGGPSDGKYLRDIVVEDNILYNLTHGISFQGNTENITIRGNLVYNTEVPISVGSENILIEENNIEGKTYRINSGDGKVRDAIDEKYFVRSSWGAEVLVEHTDGKVFEYEVTYNDGDNTYSEPEWHPSGSKFEIKSTSEEGYNGIIVKVTTYPMKLIPSTDSAKISIEKFDTSASQDKVVADFTVETADGNNVTFNIGDLIPRKVYSIKKDNNYYTTEQANACGWIQFENSEWPTLHTFTVEELPLKPVDVYKITLSPNPYVANRDKSREIRFGNLPKNATIRVYSVKGELIETMSHKSTDEGNSKRWDVSNIASGVYIYYIESPQGKTKGKISIIK